MIVKVCILLTLALIGSAERRRFDRYQLWTTTPNTQKQVNTLQTFSDKVTFWSDELKINLKAEFLVPPNHVTQMRKLFNMLHLDYHVKRHNYQEYLDNFWNRHDNKPDHYAYDYEDYNTLEEFETELVRLLDVCPTGLTCELESVGTSWEGRDMWRFKIEDAANPSDRLVWLDSLTHPREWLSGATLMLQLRHLVEDYSTDEEVQQLVSDFSFYIMPVVNPDGYEYTWTDERLWRKNTRPANEGTGCLGVDLNRNYDYVWGQHSSDVCTSETFHGPSPASEPETQVMQTQADTLNADDNLMVWISYHTAVPAWLLPYAHRTNGQCQLPDNYYDEMMPAAEAAVQAIADVNGEREWDYGSVCVILATASGDSMGYNAGVAGIRFVYAPELRGPGFDPEPEVIPLSYEENWAGLVALLNEALSIASS